MLEFLKGKGFYIALALCVAGSAGAGFMAIKKATNEAKNSTLQLEQKSELGFPDLKEAREPLTNVKKDLTLDSPKELPPSSSEQSSLPNSSSLPKNQEMSLTNQKPSITLPIPSCTVLEPYSKGELVKNKTLGDWRTHDGADFACEKGADVICALEGNVSKIYKDELWGECIEIKNNNGYSSIYRGVSPHKKLKEGDSVKEGQLIGSQSEIPCELLSATHIHFELKKGDKSLDPLDYTKN